MLKQTSRAQSTFTGSCHEHRCAPLLAAFARHGALFGCTRIIGSLHLGPYESESVAHPPAAQPDSAPTNQTSMLSSLHKRTVVVCTACTDLPLVVALIVQDIFILDRSSYFVVVLGLMRVTVTSTCLDFCAWDLKSVHLKVALLAIRCCSSTCESTLFDQNNDTRCISSNFN